MGFTAMTESMNDAHITHSGLLRFAMHHCTMSRFHLPLSFCHASHSQWASSILTVHQRSRDLQQ